MPESLLSNIMNDEFLTRQAMILADELLSGNHHLVTAESCTGGWIAKVCTDLPGSSRWFAGGVVSYANHFKIDWLRVKSQSLELAGAVSEVVVREMLAGVVADEPQRAGIAVSGIAGPDGGSPEKPVGTVWFAFQLPDSQVICDVQHFSGDRESVRRQAVAHALGFLAEQIKNKNLC